MMKKKLSDMLVSCIHRNTKFLNSYDLFKGDAAETSDFEYLKKYDCILEYLGTFASPFGKIIRQCEPLFYKNAAVALAWYQFFFFFLANLV